jgi:hypothetical protein
MKRWYTTCVVFTHFIYIYIFFFVKDKFILLIIPVPFKYNLAFLTLLFIS